MLLLDPASIREALDHAIELGQGLEVGRPSQGVEQAGLGGDASGCHALGCEALRLFSHGSCSHGCTSGGGALGSHALVAEFVAILTLRVETDLIRMYEVLI